MKFLDSTLDKIEKYCRPKSIFLFGSQARNDHLEKSDYEIGVLFNEKNYVGENKLKEIIRPPHRIRIYPYKFKEFIQGRIIFPFQNNIFLREILVTGKTLRGEKIVEKITPPSITVVDLMQDLKFSVARGSDAILCFSVKDKKIASILFYKSCLFGTRNLIILVLKEFPNSYPEIRALSKKLTIANEYREIISHAYKIRQGSNLKREFLFRNISYLTKFIEKKLIGYYKKHGDKVLIY